MSNRVKAFMMGMVDWCYIPQTFICIGVEDYKQKYSIFIIDYIEGISTSSDDRVRLSEIEFAEVEDCNPYLDKLGSELLKRGIRKATDKNLNTILQIAKKTTEKKRS